MKAHESLHSVLFEAEDVNDKNWTPIIKILDQNGYGVCYGNDNWMTIYKKDEVFHENYHIKGKRASSRND